MAEIIVALDLPGRSPPRLNGRRRPQLVLEDQVRTATPEQAVTAGATHLVVGRPLIQAAEPADVFHELMEAVA